MNATSKSRIIRMAPEDERALASVSIHEAGHETVAEAFKLNPETFVAAPHAGVCTYDGGTAEQDAAVSWAGVLAEDMLDARNALRSLPAVALSKATLGRWRDEMTTPAGLAQLSPEDRQGIEAFPSATACETAFRILSERLYLVRFTAGLLAEASRERVHANIQRASVAANEFDVQEFQSTANRQRRATFEAESAARTTTMLAELDALQPAPEPMVIFPASLGDFLRVVCGSEREAVRFVRFLQHVTGDSEAALERLAESGFTRESWTATALRFVAWR